MESHVSTIYPWNESRWNRTIADIERMSHAVLLKGVQGVGKQAFAMALGEFLLCEDRNGNISCGKCRGCRLFISGNHPDFHFLTPEAAIEDVDSVFASYASRHFSTQDKNRKPKVVISIDQIRSFIDSLTMHSHRQGRRVAIISPAEKMNRNAANALLKCLEEPPPGTILLLVSANTHRLPATIRSRCTAIDFYTPDRETARAWLQENSRDGSNLDLLLHLAGGSPLLAWTMAEQNIDAEIARKTADIMQLVAGKANPVGITQRWLELTPEWNNYALQRLFSDAIRLKLVPENTISSASDLAEDLILLAKRFTVQQLYALYDLASRNRGDMDGVLDQNLVYEYFLAKISLMRQSE